MNAAIVLDNVTKNFGSSVAVKGLNLKVPAGGLYGFIGPNGAGKTTTIRLITSNLLPDSGRISVLGESSALAAKDRIGYMPEERGLYHKMKVGSFLFHMARLKGVEESSLHGLVRRWLDRVGLADVEKNWCAELSRGMQWKIQFVAAMIHEPDLLILDEPFSEPDAVNMRLLRELALEQRARGATILFSTNVMSQAERFCDHIVMIHRGKKVLDETLDAARVRCDSKRILLEPLDDEIDVVTLKSVSGVDAIEITDYGFELTLSVDADVTKAIAEIAAVAPPRHLELQRPTLEDVFLTLVEDASR